MMTYTKAQELQNTELTTASPQKLHFANDLKCNQFDCIEAVQLTTRVITHFAHYGDGTSQCFRFDFLVLLHLVNACVRY